jgi:hypothetical protein
MFPVTSTVSVAYLAPLLRAGFPIMERLVLPDEQVEEEKKKKEDAERRKLSRRRGNKLY